MKIVNLNWIKNLIAIAIPLFIFSLLFYRIDVNKVLVTIYGSDPKLFLLAVSISLSVNIFLGAAKWRRILLALGFPLPFKEVLSIWSGCLPLKVVFPVKSSELFKAFYLQKQRGFLFMRAVSSIVLDKTLNLLVTLGIFLIGLLLVDIKFPRFLPIAALLALTVFLFSSRLRSIFINVSKTIHNKLFSITEQLLSSFEDISLKEKIILLCYSIVCQSSEFINTYILFRAVGVFVPFSLVLVLIPLIIVINNLPLTILGLGTREALMIFLFAKYGTSTSLLSASLLVSFVEHILPVVFGLSFTKSFLRCFIVQQRLVSEGKATAIDV